MIILTESDHIRSGLWIIVGIVAFIFIGKLFQQSTNHDSKKIMGYLNLLANSIDNFIHGLAVASSFLTSFKLGFTTVFAILVHEIPHEIGDFAILLNSGFTRYVLANRSIKYLYLIWREKFQNFRIFIIIIFSDMRLPKHN